MITKINTSVACCVVNKLYQKTRFAMACQNTLKTDNPFPYLYYFRIVTIIPRQRPTNNNNNALINRHGTFPRTIFRFISFPLYHPFLLIK